jgi:hypothetical protein
MEAIGQRLKQAWDEIEASADNKAALITARKKIIKDEVLTPIFQATRRSRPVTVTLGDGAQAEGEVRIIKIGIVLDGFNLAYAAAGDSNCSKSLPLHRIMSIQIS